MTSFFIIRSDLFRMTWPLVLLLLFSGDAVELVDLVDGRLDDPDIDRTSQQPALFDLGAMPRDAGANHGCQSVNE